MYNLIEYGGNYLKTSGSLLQCYRYVSNDILTNSESFKFKVKITGKTPATGNTQDVKISVLLKYLSNFWRTLVMPLINCEINLILIWSTDYVLSFATGEAKHYVSILTLSTPDNAKLLEHSVLKEQLTGININQKCQQNDKTNIKIS